MKLTIDRLLGTIILTVALCLQSPALRAEIVSTDQLTAQSAAGADRAKVQAFIERAGVAEKLQAMGVAGLVAKDRIAALNDAEIHTLAAKIDALPTGGNVGSFTNDQVIIVLLIAILVAIIA
jgi:hypothetical protein